MKKTCMVLAMTLAASAAQAGGFFIPEQGARAVGMGNAFTGLADDASANWYNPAALAFQPDSASASLDLIRPRNDYSTGGQSYSAKKETFVVPQLYAAIKPLEGKPLTLGLGVNAPFGLSTDWTNSGAPFSKLAAGADSVTFSQIEAVHSNLNAVWQVSDRLAVAAGGSWYHATKVHLDNALLQIKGDGDGFGGNLAVFWRGDAVSLGVSWRSRVKLDITGLAVGLSTLPAPYVGMSGGAKTSVTLPDLLMLGLSWRPDAQWTLTAQADWTNWKTFDRIVLDFDPSLLTVVTGTQKVVPENWKAVITWRLGAQWAYAPDQRLRLGYVNDPTPTNNVDLSPRLPGNDRQLVTLGWGMDIGEAMTLDLAYAYVWLKTRNLTTANTTIYNGTYTSNVHILTGGLNWRF
ncbi:MAG: outer membrane protein transport protein [Mariprofundaceae bacterium]